MPKTPTQLQTFTPPSDSAMTSVVVTPTSNQQSLKDDYQSLIENPQRDFDERAQNLAVQNQENVGNLYKGLRRVTKGLTKILFFGGENSKVVQLKPEEYYKQGLASAIKGVETGNSQKHQEALSDFDKAIKSGLKTREVFYEKGLTHTRLNQYPEALIAVNRGLELDPNNYEMLYIKAVAHERLGQYQEALSACNQAIKLEPESYEALYESGIILANLGQYQEALNDFNRALELNIPNSRNVDISKADSHLKLGQYHYLAADIAKIIFKAPFDPTVNSYERILHSCFMTVALLSISSMAYITMRRPNRRLAPPRQAPLPAWEERIEQEIEEVRIDNVVVDIDDIEDIANVEGAINYEDMRLRIRHSVVPFLHFYIEDHAISDKEKQRMQALPTNIAEEIFDKISGYDDKISVREFIEEKLKTGTDLYHPDRKALRKTFMMINQSLQDIRLIQRNYTGLYNAIYNAAYDDQNRFIKSIFKEAVKIFDEEVPKYLKAEHQKLLDQKDNAPNSVSQATAVAVAPTADRDIGDSS